MNIRLFLELSKEFFELIHPPIVEDIAKNDNYEKNLEDEEKGWQELSDDEEYEEETCCCKLIRQISLFINPGIYKKLNANKVD